MKQKLYNPVIDVLRIISILAIILIHTTTRTLEASVYSLQNSVYYLSKNLWPLYLNQVTRFAVPLFFMISGFVLELNYPFHANYFTYLKKRLNRILIPYIFWSGIYYFLIYRNNNDNFFQVLLNGSASHQLYFIPALLIFYLIFPFLHKYFYKFNNKLIVAGLGILQLLILYHVYYIGEFSLYYPLSIILFNYFVFFLGVFGVHHYKKLLVIINKWKVIIFFLIFLLGNYIFLEGKNRYEHTHNYLSFYSSWRPEVLVYTILLAGFLYYLFYKKVVNIYWIRLFSRLSLFIFFIHILILEAVWYGIGAKIVSGTNGSVAKQFWFDPLFFMTVTFISFAIAYLVHKIPKLIKITG